MERRLQQTLINNQLQGDVFGSTHRTANPLNTEGRENPFKSLREVLGRPFLLRQTPISSLELELIYSFSTGSFLVLFRISPTIGTLKSLMACIPRYHALLAGGLLLGFSTNTLTLSIMDF